MNEGMSLPTKVACIALVVGILVCFRELAQGNLTVRETIVFRVLHRNSERPAF